jgi:UDP-glucose 4-epimerase
MMDPHPDHTVVNLGTGQAHSVLEVLYAFMRTSGRAIPYDMVERRAGDVPVSYADVSLARQFLEWKTRRDLDRMCADAWRWQEGNPTGYPA